MLVRGGTIAVEPTVAVLNLYLCFPPESGEVTTAWSGHGLQLLRSLLRARPLLFSCR